jgi:hypothetical protein
MYDRDESEEGVIFGKSESFPENFRSPQRSNRLFAEDRIRAVLMEQM